jgi:hypothetical protein
MALFLLLVAVGFRCKKPVNIDDCAFRPLLAFAAICPKNAKQYQIAVSDLALTTTVIFALLETLEKTSRASSVSSSDQCNVLFARSLFIRLAPRSSTPPRPDNGPARRPRMTCVKQKCSPANRRIDNMRYNVPSRVFSILFCAESVAFVCTELVVPRSAEGERWPPGVTLELYGACPNSRDVGGQKRGALI